MSTMAKGSRGSRAMSMGMVRSAREKNHPKNRKASNKGGEQAPEQHPPQAVEGGAHLKEHGKARKGREDHRQGGHLRVGQAKGPTEGAQGQDVGGHGQRRGDAHADDV